MKFRTERLIRSLAPLILIGCVTIASHGQSPIPYSTGFESPTFSVGSLPQDGWTALGGNPVIQTGTVFAGAQALEVPAGAATEKTFTSTPGSTVWIDGRTRVSPENGAPDPTLLRDGSTFLFFDATTGILALNGNGSGSGTWSQTGVNPAPGTWVRISLAIDFSAKTYAVYVDGVLRLSGLGFRNNSIDRLNGFSVDHRNASGGSYLDAFSASTSAPDFMATPTPTSTPAPTNTPTPQPTNTPTATPTSTPVPPTVTPTPTQPVAAGGVLSLDPTVVQMPHPPAAATVPNATRLFDVRVEYTGNFDTFDVQMAYDSGAIGFDGAADFQPGPLMTGAGGAISLLEQTYNNTAGTASFAASVAGGVGYGGGTETGVLARIALHSRPVTQATAASFAIVDASLLLSGSPINAAVSGGSAVITVCYYADLDCDDAVTIIDIQKVAGRWNTEIGDPQYDPLYDIDHDGDIDIADIQMVAGQWNKTAPF